MPEIPTSLLTVSYTHLDVYKRQVYNSADDEFIETTKYFCRVSAHFKCYGPNCYENALRIKEKLFTENIKWELGQLNLLDVYKRQEEHSDREAKLWRRLKSLKGK